MRDLTTLSSIIAVLLCGCSPVHSTLVPVEDAGADKDAIRGGDAFPDAPPNSTPPPDARSDPSPPDARPDSPPPGDGRVDCTHREGGNLHSVGPDQQLKTLGEVPWNQLGAGDMVRIDWRPEPYTEKILVSKRGTTERPIRICGVPGPNGEQPVLEGRNATTAGNTHWSSWTPLQDLGVVVFSRDADQPTYSTRPGHVVIEGLEIRGAHRDNTYTASTGETRTYANGAASIAITPGDNIMIRGCTLTGSGQGIFTLSKSEHENTLVREIVIERNRIFGNGVVGSDRQHNAYIQALGVLVQYNYFGPTRQGALGGNLKDRSAGTVIRYNYIDGGARTVDLVDAQEHVTHALADPRYRTTFLYGNILIARPGAAANIIHFGGDTQGFEQNFRKGTLYAYQNTILIERNLDENYTVQVVDASTMDETVDFRNNIVHRTGSSGLYLMRYSGVAQLGVNWITAGWQPGRSSFSGTVNGAENALSGPSPGLDATTLRPRAGSPIIDNAGPLAAAAGDHPVGAEYIMHATGRTRLLTGNGLDLGALELE
ncbi:MAG: hypothetical protein HY698_12270 [Deltaproteobacteria bacterium]|nr:hypothetical protein [Deltaproteobacteria bacterium]